jgi:hypothetical protein
MSWHYHKTDAGIEIRDILTSQLVATVHTGTTHAHEIVAAHNAIVEAREDLVLARAIAKLPAADHEALAQDARETRRFLRRLGL